MIHPCSSPDAFDAWLESHDIFPCRPSQWHGNKIRTFYFSDEDAKRTIALVKSGRLVYEEEELL